LSSAILYLAIVAIWAVVLVPRWLRPRPAPPQPVPVPAEPANAEWREPAGPGQDAGAAWVAGASDGPLSGGPLDGGPLDGGPLDGGPVTGEPAGGGDVASVDAAGDEDAADEDGEATLSSPATRRAEVLKARRRLLTTLVTLTAIAVALVVTRIDAYWIVLPPAVLLGGYLTLLRKFARIDAERARRAARIRHAPAGAGAGHAAGRAGAGPEPAASPVPVAPPAAAGPDLGPAPDPGTLPGGAEIIDISGRIGDQVYDQYSDAANRAVGD
jgi:hypothetical protein